MKASDQNMVGVDLDRTLAKFKEQNWDEYKPGQIGEPIPLMVERVRKHMDQGDEIVIITARVHPWKGDEAEEARKSIQEWCMNIFGQAFEVTCMKHPRMHTIYDDRAVTVEPNTGRILTVGFVEPGGLQADSLGSLLEE
jgi:hypothetical protein